MEPLWWRDIFQIFLCAFICRYDNTNGYRFIFGLGSRYCRAIVGFDSGMCRPTPRNSVLCRTWFGLGSALNRCQFGRHMVEFRPTRPRTLPNNPDTTPTYNRQTTDNLSGKDLSNMFERSLPDKCVCPNINRHQTDKTEPLPTVNRSLHEFDEFCRFEVGFVSVWPVWLGII